MLSINMADVINVLNLCAPYLIALGVILAAGVNAMVACGKCAKSTKYLVRTQSGIAMVLALVIVVNLICFGPMNTLISLATGSGIISDETNAEAQALCEEIADEGITLLDNDGGLPLKGTKLNVFGWASTNPVYGGVGSGALSDTYPTVSLLDGLKNAGIETNTELSQFYTDYRADRPVVNAYVSDAEGMQTENGVSIFEWMAQQKGEGKLPELPLEKKVYENPITFYLVRHGETEYNTQHLMQGWCDSPLTQNGIDLSKKLGKGLADIDFVAAYSSDSGRAVDTAKNVLEGRDVTLTTDENLREMFFGEVEGLPSAEVYTSEEIFAYCMWISGFDLFGGETWEGLGQRMHAALENAAYEYSEEGGNILISTHGMSILATLYNTVPDAEGVMDQGEIDNCSVTILEWDNGVYTLKALNDTSYLG